MDWFTASGAAYARVTHLPEPTLRLVHQVALWSAYPRGKREHLIASIGGDWWEVPSVRQGTLVEAVESLLELGLDGDPRQAEELLAHRGAESMIDLASLAEAAHA
jgi:hypothetical protein